MAPFKIQPHSRLQEWVAEEKDYFRDEGLDYVFHMPGSSLDEMGVGRTYHIQSAEEAPSDVKLGAFETMEQGRTCDISAACHWAVNMASSGQHGRMWGHAYSVTPSAVYVAPESSIRRPTDLVGVKHKDISFRPTGSHVEKAAFFLNPKHDLNYALGLQYHFSPLAGWDGEKLSYELPTVSSLDRTLLVNPFRDFGFFEIKIVPGDLDPDMIDSTDVQLHYEHPGRWARDKVITVHPGGPQQSWKLRLSDPLQQTYTYKWIHRLKDGTSRETAPLASNIPLITVNDPFEEPLLIELFPNYDTASIRLLIVDVTYEDPDALKPRVQQIKFQPADTVSKRIRFARTDPTIDSYSIQLTILGLDNSVRRLRPVRLKESIVFLGEHMGQETLSRRWS